jgi:hypothetical protein
MTRYPSSSDAIPPCANWRPASGKRLRAGFAAVVNEHSSVTQILFRAQAEILSPTEPLIPAGHSPVGQEFSFAPSAERPKESIGMPAPKRSRIESP